MNPSRPAFALDRAEGTRPAPCLDLMLHPAIGAPRTFALCSLLRTIIVYVTRHSLDSYKQ